MHLILGETVAIIAGMSALLSVSPAFLLISPIACFPAVKFLKDANIWKGQKDISFIAMHKGKNCYSLGQDVTMLHLISKMRGLTEIEKLGFMQLQTLIGIANLNDKSEKGETIKYKTITHSANLKTLKWLYKEGYIDNYEEQYKRDSRLIIAKIGFGNFNFTEKKEMWEASFTKTDKEIDFNDENMRKRFPMCFARKGIMAKKEWGLYKDEEGKFHIDYNSREPFICGRSTLKGRCKRFRKSHKVSKEKIRNVGLPKRKIFQRTKEDRYGKTR